MDGNSIFKLHGSCTRRVSPSQLLLFGLSTDPLIRFFSLSILWETVEVRALADLSVSGFSFLSATGPAVVDPDLLLLLLVAAM